MFNAVADVNVTLPRVRYFGRSLHFEVLEGHPLFGPRQLLFFAINQETLVGEGSLAQAFRLTLDDFGEDCKKYDPLNN